MTQDEYQNYLRSEYWIRFSRSIRQVRKVCERCRFPYELNVHHRSYHHLWHEQANDVVLLCKACHSRHHFVDSADELPSFVFEVSPAVTRERLKRQIEQARQRNVERADEIRLHREREEDM